MEPSMEKIAKTNYVVEIDRTEKLVRILKNRGQYEGLVNALLHMFPGYSVEDNGVLFYLKARL